MTVHYAVIDVASGTWKRFGTCAEIDLVAQASEPGELAFECPHEVAAETQKVQRAYSARRDPVTKLFLTDEERGPLKLPYRALVQGGRVVINRTEEKG